MRVRFMRVGIVLCVLFACGHFAGFLEAAHAARHDPALADVTAAMRSHRASVLGMHPSLLDFREYFSASFSLLLALVAALNVIAARGGDARMQRRLAAVDAVAFSILAGLSAWFSVPQGIISCAVIAAVFAWSSIAPDRAPIPGPDA